MRLLAAFVQCASTRTARAIMAIGIVIVSVAFGFIGEHYIQNEQSLPHFEAGLGVAAEEIFVSLDRIPSLLTDEISSAYRSSAYRQADKWILLHTLCVVATLWPLCLLCVRPWTALPGFCRAFIIGYSALLFLLTAFCFLVTIYLYGIYFKSGTM